MKKKDIILVAVFLILVCIYLRKLFLGMVPVPGNLLVWFFSPWKEVVWPQYPGGVFKQGLFGFDTIRQIYPWRWFTTGQLLSGNWPLWNPHQFSGAPHLANFQTAIFYPFNLLYLFLPSLFAWTFNFALQTIGAGVFMYLFARKRFSRQAAFIAAVSWAFSVPLSVWLVWNIHGHQFALLPLIFYLVEKYRDKPKMKILFCLGLVLVITFLAGHPQIFIYIYIFSGFYFFTRTRKIFPWLVAGIATGLITCIAWLPMLEYYRFASRDIFSSEFNFEKTLLPVENLITFSAPDFFGNPTTANYWGKHDYTESSVYAGIIAFALALIAFFSRARSKSKFFWVSALALTGLSLNWFVPRLIGRAGIPIFTQSVATRVLFMVTFCLSVLSAFGWESLRSKKTTRPVWGLGIFLLGLIFFLASAPKIFNYQSWFENIRVAIRNLILPLAILSVFLGALVAGLKQRLFFALCILLMVFDLFWIANKVIPFTWPQLVFPWLPVLSFLQTRNDYFRIGSTPGAGIESNFATYYGLYSADGYDTLYPRWYGELVWSGASGKYESDISRTTVVLSVDSGQPQKKLKNLLGVKYFLAKNDPAGPDCKVSWEDENWRVCENEAVFPRAFLVGSWQILDQKQEAIERFYAEDFNPRSQVILAQDPGINQTDIVGEASIVSYSPAKVVIKTRSQADNLLFLSDTYYPGWQARVDGRKEKIYKADWAFRGVPVPAGEHEITFVYSPASFYWGRLVSVFSLIFFAALFSGMIAKDKLWKK